MQQMVQLALAQCQSQALPDTRPQPSPYLALRSGTVSEVAPLAAGDMEASDSEARDLEASDPEASDSEASDSEAGDSEASDSEANDWDASVWDASDTDGSDADASDTDVSDADADTRTSPSLPPPADSELTGKQALDFKTSTWTQASVSWTWRRIWPM